MRILLLLLLVMLPGCSRFYEREKPIPQICKDLGKLDCR